MIMLNWKPEVLVNDYQQAVKLIGRARVQASFDMMRVITLPR